MISPTPARFAAQAALYAAFGALVAFLSGSPRYPHLPPDQALIRISVSHPGQPRGECRQRSAEELAKLAPNMRAPLDCPRERFPVRIRAELDGAVLFEALLPPAGLARDGASSAYERFPVAPGRHRLKVEVGDDGRPDFGYRREATVELAPLQALLIDFLPAEGGIVFR